MKYFPQFDNIKKFLEKVKFPMFCVNLINIAIGLIVFLIVRYQNKIDKLLTSINILEFKEDTLYIIFLSVIVLIPSIIKSIVFALTYKKRNHITIDKDKTLMPGCILYSVLLLFSTFVFIVTLIDEKSFYWKLFVILTVIGAEIFFWLPYSNNIDEKGSAKDKSFLSLWLGVIGFLILMLLDLIRNDLINMLTWYLPVFVPVIIGNIHESEEEKKHFEATAKMKTHVFWLTTYSFSSLLILNVLNSIFSDNRGDNSLIITIRDILNQTDLKDTPVLTKLYSSFIFSFIAIFMGLFVSQNLVKILQKYYLNEQNGYFKKK